MALPLKVLILRIPNCNLVARVLIRCPTCLHLVEGGQCVEVVVLWVPIPPSREDDLLVIHSGVPASH